MTTCPTCRGPMKPLFQSWFCPKDCDRVATAPRDMVVINGWAPPGWARGLTYTDPSSGKQWYVQLVHPGFWPSVSDTTWRGWYLMRQPKSTGDIDREVDQQYGIPGWAPPGSHKESDPNWGLVFRPV